MTAPPSCNKDGTVTYWSVYQQTWVYHARGLPDAELAALDAHTRARVLAHLTQPRYSVAP